MQLKIRDLKRFGISGLMSEKGSILYSSDFKTRSVGRVSDLIAAKLKDLHADELRLRALLLYGLYESNAVSTSGEEVVSKPVSLEVGLESDYLAVGVSFNWSESSRPDFDALVSRVSLERNPKNDFEKILSLIHQHSDHVFVRYCEDPHQIEVVSVISLGGERAEASKLEVIRVDEARSEAIPEVSEYKELGDLPFVELTKDEDVVVTGDAPLHTDDSMTIAGGSPEAEAEQKISGSPQEAEAIQNVKGRPGEAESEQKVSGLPQEKESIQNVSGTGPEAESFTRISSDPAEEIDGMSVISAKEAENGIEAELRKVQGLPTEKEIFMRLKADGFSEPELLMLKQSSTFTPEIRQRLQASNVLPEEIQRMQLLGQQQQFVQRLETSGFTPVEIQTITSGVGIEPDLIRRLTGLGYQPPEVENLFSHSFELAEKIYQIRSGNDPVPIEAYRRVAAPVYTREELLAKVRSQFPELDDIEALKQSNAEFQRLAQAARDQLRNHLAADALAPKSNDAMADWLSSFSQNERPDIKKIPFNPHQLHAVEAAFGRSDIDIKSLSDSDYNKFMDAIRKPQPTASSRNVHTSDFAQNRNSGSFQNQQAAPQGPKTSSSSPVNKTVPIPDAKIPKQDQLESELLKKRIRELENQLKTEKSNKQNVSTEQRTVSGTDRADPRSNFGQSGSQSKSGGMVGPTSGITRTPGFSSANLSAQEENDNDSHPIEKIEVKGETKKVPSRGAFDQVEKKNKESLFTKLFKKEEESATQSANVQKPGVAQNPLAASASNDEKIVISGKTNTPKEEPVRLIQGSEQNRGLTGIDQKEFEKVKRELALKDKRHQEQSELLQRKLVSMKESFEKSERERVQAVREREKMKSELEQARIRIASAQIPETGATSSIQDETVTVVRGSNQAQNPRSNTTPMRGAPAQAATSVSANSNLQAQGQSGSPSGKTGDVKATTVSNASTNESRERENPAQGAQQQAPKKSGGFGFLKNLNPFSSKEPENKPDTEPVQKAQAPTAKSNPEKASVAEQPDSKAAPVIEGIDPRVLAMKEKVHERQVDELHRKIKKLEEDNAKLREKTVRADSQILDQNSKTLKASAEPSRDIQDTSKAEVPEKLVTEAEKEIQERKRKIEEEDQKTLIAAAAVEPATLKPVAKEIADPETRAHTVKAAKMLDDLKSAVEKTDSPAVKKVLSEIQQSGVEPTKSKQWTDSLMAEIVSEKARIMDLQRTLQTEFKAAEQSYRNRENLLQADLQKRDDILRQKEALLNRKNEQLAQLNVQLDQMKQGSLAVEEAQLKHKLAAAQKLAEMKDFENKSLLEKSKDLENKLMIANAKARNTNEAQWKQKIQALEFKLEEAKKQALRNQDLTTQTKDKANDRELLDLKKKYELAERQQQEMKKLLERTAANLKDKTDGERKFQLEAQKLQEENKKLKAIISRTGNNNSGSNAA